MELPVVRIKNRRIVVSLKNHAQFSRIGQGDGQSVLTREVSCTETEPCSNALCSPVESAGASASFGGVVDVGVVAIAGEGGSTWSVFQYPTASSSVRSERQLPSTEAASG